MTKYSNISEMQQAAEVLALTARNAGNLSQGAPPHEDTYVLRRHFLVPLGASSATWACRMGYEANTVI